MVDEDRVWSTSGYQLISGSGLSGAKQQALRGHRQGDGAAD
jgi:hypothetical protein